MNDLRFTGNVPQMNRGPEGPGIKALFHSERRLALIFDKTLQGGFGVLKQGTILAENSVSGLIMPYIGDDHQDTNNVGRSFLLADYVSDATTVEVTIDDSYKFQVGDDLIMVRDNAGSPEYQDGGEITDIAIGLNSAVITFTTGVTSAAFTRANDVNIYTKCGAATKFSKAKYLLDQDVDTGYGEYTLAQGGHTSVVISNAVLYLTALVNYDAQAATDLGAVEDGRFLVMK
jgi:hypothetical protein